MEPQNTQRREGARLLRRLHLRIAVLAACVVVTAAVAASLAYAQTRTSAPVGTGVVVIDTNIALEDDELRRAAGTLWIDPDTRLSPIHTVQVDGESYRGRSYFEHDPGSLPEQRERAMWASLNNETSFWLTKPSLVNALMRAGFTSVLECLVPPLPGLPPDRVHLAAIAGQRRALLSSSIGADVEYERLAENGPHGAQVDAHHDPRYVERRLTNRVVSRALATAGVWRRLWK